MTHFYLNFAAGNLMPICITNSYIRTEAEERSLALSAYILAEIYRPLYSFYGS